MKHLPGFVPCTRESVAALLPEYWDTGAAIVLFAELARRAIEKRYRWADLSLTSEDNPDT
jgi:hypothetical protein